MDISFEEVLRRLTRDTTLYITRQRLGAMPIDLHIEHFKRKYRGKVKKKSKKGRAR